MRRYWKLKKESLDRTLRWTRFGRGKMERRIKVTGRRERRRKQLLDNFKETRGYWKLKKEALERTLRWTRFGRGCGPVLRQTAEWMNEWMNGPSAQRNTRIRTIQRWIMRINADILNSEQKSQEDTWRKMTSGQRHSKCTCCYSGKGNSTMNCPTYISVQLLHQSLQPTGQQSPPIMQQRQPLR